MGLPEVYLAPNALRGFEDRFAETVITGVQNNLELLSITLRPGLVAKLVAYRMAWDSTLNTYITLRLLAGVTPIYPYQSTTVQLGAPEQDHYLPVPLILPQGTVLRVTADIATGPTFNANATVRLIVLYEDPHQSKGGIQV